MMLESIIVVVPPGTRVLYVENPYTDGKVLVMNADELLRAPIEPSPLGVIGDPFGVPVFEAKRWTDV